MNGESILAKRHRLEHVEIYEVMGDELDRIEVEAGTIGTDLQFASVLIPVALSFTAALFLTTISSTRIYIGFLTVTVISYVLGAYFTYRWYLQRGTFKRLLEKIRARRIGPVGESGKEKTPAELAELPSSEPPTPAAEGGN